MSGLDAALALAASWLALGAAALSAPHSARLPSRVLYPAGAAVGLLVALVGLHAMSAPAASRTLPLGLPDLPFHVRLDALSGFFLFLLGAVSAGVSVFAAGYFRTSRLGVPGLQCLAYHAFLASMALVLLA
ncbi:MAG TPA: hydrogenase 4 subunit B, partial [Burkholderiales bacterium]|nr:hydrogenase 4 subunit B [Burkholderiales bacterium]